NYTITVQEAHTLRSLSCNALLDVMTNATLTLNNFFNNSSIKQLVLEGGTAIKTTAGTTTLAGGGYLYGNLDVAAAAHLNLTRGTQPPYAGAALTGAGQFTVNGATLSLNADLDAPANFELKNGNLGGNKNWNVGDNTMQRSGGAMYGTGSTILAAQG